MTTSHWSTRHGDSEVSPVWAVLNPDGTELNLAGWDILAQAREDSEADSVVVEFTRDHGVTVGSAEVRLPSGRKVTTSTVQLYLNPGDWQYLPRVWTGVFDVEISLPSSDPGEPPVRRHTVVDDGHLTISPDVSRGSW